MDGLIVVNYKTYEETTGDRAVAWQGYVTLLQRRQRQGLLLRRSSLISTG